MAATDGGGLQRGDRHALHGHGGVTLHGRFAPVVNVVVPPWALLSCRGDRRDTSGAHAKPSQKLVSPLHHLATRDDGHALCAPMTCSSACLDYASRSSCRPSWALASFYRASEVLSYHLVKGGVYLSEHPVARDDPTRPTIWRAGLTELLRGHPDARLQRICQCEWGAGAVKPTGLLGLRMLSKGISEQALPRTRSMLPLSPMCCAA